MILVECRLLIYDVAIVRSKCIADDAHGNPLCSRLVYQCRAVSRPNSRDALSVTPRHSSMTLRFIASLKSSSNERASDFKDVAMLIFCASQVDDAVLP